MWIVMIPRSPEGTFDNSPAIYRRVSDRKASRPNGTLERFEYGSRN